MRKLSSFSELLNVREEELESRVAFKLPYLTKNLGNGLVEIIVYNCFVIHHDNPGDVYVYHKLPGSERIISENEYNCWINSLKAMNYLK